MRTIFAFLCITAVAFAAPKVRNKFNRHIKHNNCMYDPLRQKKLIKNQIKWSKLTYDNTFTYKKSRKN